MSAPQAHGGEGSPSTSFGSSARKPPRSSASNFLNGASCQSTGPSFSPSSVTPGLEEPFDRAARLGELLGIDDGAMALHREDEILRRLVAPLGETLRPLAAIERAVDLDGGQLPARVLKLAPRRQLLRIEDAAPGGEGPAADADADLRRLALLCLPCRPQRALFRRGIGDFLRHLHRGDRLSGVMRTVVRYFRQRAARDGGKTGGDSGLVAWRLDDRHDRRIRRK